MKSNLLLSLVATASLLAGCAGSVPDAEFRRALAPENRICEKDTAEVKVSAASGVELVDRVRTRIEQKIKLAINKQKAGSLCNTPQSRNFNLETKITRYEEGNAFARAMLAGLGQIHVDGDSVMNLAGQLVTDFSVSKTFAFGGVYGASVNVEEIENTFSEAVAKAIVIPASEKSDKVATNNNTGVNQ